MLLAHYLLLDPYITAKTEVCSFWSLWKDMTVQKGREMSQVLMSHLPHTPPPPPQHIFAEWQLHYILRNTWVDLINTKGKAKLYLYFSGTFPALITGSVIPLALLSNGSPLAAARLSVNSCSNTLFEHCLIRRSPSVPCLSALSFYWRTQHHLLGALSNFLDLDQHLLVSFC